MEYPLHTYKPLFSEALGAANSVMQQQAMADTPLIPELIAHIIASGGKRLRPILTLLSAELLGYQGQRHIQLAAAIEFFHTATLLHDDVVDESTLRRGQETANAIWSNQASVLVGDFLLSRAFQLIARDENPKITQILADASATIAEGEVAQMVSSGDVALPYARYKHIIYGKTAALFEAATETGARIATQDEAAIAALKDYGRALGMAFQMMDDSLDYTATADQLGKAPGDDIREGKVTLPFILLRDSDDETISKQAMKAFEAEEVDALLQLAKEQQIDAKCHAKATEYAKQAQQALATLPDIAQTQHIQALHDIAAYAVHRKS